MGMQVSKTRPVEEEKIFRIRACRMNDINARAI